MREQHQKFIYRNRNLLRQTEDFSSVYINEDLPQIIVQRRADIRSVYLNAKDKGHEAKMMGTKLTVDKISYRHKDLESLPNGLKLSDSKVVKVKGGLAFATGNAYLSNFYKCEVKFNGIVFDSAERAYQYERCDRLGAPELAQQILDARDAKACKGISYFVKSNNEWDAQKRDLMKLIVYEKFVQNEALLDRLLLTGKKALIEATVDMFWGAAAVIGSKLLKNGTWKGRNELGLILAEVREDLKRERNWIEMRASSSDDQSPVATPPHTQPTEVLGASVDDDPINQNEDHDNDLTVLTQSTQNISLRKNTNRSRKRGNKLSKQKTNQKTSLDSLTGGVSPPNGNQPVAPVNQYPHVSQGHAQLNLPGIPGSVPTQSHMNQDPNSLGLRSGSQSVLTPNVNVPPPGFHPWSWPYGVSPYITSSTQPTGAGMFVPPPPWSNLSNLSAPFTYPQPNMNQMHSQGNNHRATTYSQPGLHSDISNIKQHGFQKKSRASLQRSGRSAGARDAVREVRSKSLAASTLPQDEDITFRIGTQAL